MDLLVGGPKPARSSSGRVRGRRTWIKALLVVGAALAALFLTVYRDNGIHLGADGTSRAASESGRDYDLAALRVFSQVLVRAKEQYADPTRIDPRAMLLAALDYVQRSTPEVMVDEQPSDRILVRVDAAEKTFSIAGVDSPWTLSSKLKQIFRFIQGHVHAGQDIREIEYAATNGMLSTLDTHSVLLNPELYKEMKLSTRGEFGGLGIIIGIRKGKLTILSPIKDTPAFRAGLKKRDHIAKINQESTVNMTLTDAVGRLRGKPGSKVTVWIERKNSRSQRRYVLTRAIIRIQSVHAQLLKGNVGYLRINGFHNKTDEQLSQEMENLMRLGARSYLVDLRWNPGGLLDQAVKVADAFVDAGMLVATVGLGGKKREENRAQSDDEPRVPMAVLTDFRTASAAEIVAGALRNLDRAVVLGQTTFGKGSVQVLHENNDGSALKLTVAQYLTPGDVSIQAVGISPDLKLVPVVIEKGRRVHLVGEPRVRRERDYEERPLRQEGIRAVDKPADEIRYLADPRPAPDPDEEILEEGDEEDEEDLESRLDPTLEGEKFVEDAEIRIARDLLAQASGWRRSEVLSGAHEFLAKRKQEEEDRIREALGRLGVDWSGEGGSGSSLVVRAAFDGPKSKLIAGEERKLTVTVRNSGSSVASRVHAITRCENRLLDQREFPIGKLEPGESRSWTADVKVPLRALTRTDVVHIDLVDGPESRRPTAEIRADVEGLPRPLFAYGYQVIDGKRGSTEGDGLIQPNERIHLRVDVKNTGVGTGIKTWATIQNLSGNGIFIHKGRFELGRMEPGDSSSADFELEVQPRYTESSFRLELAVYDEKLGDFVSEKLDFALADPRPISAVSSAFARTRSHVDVRAGADAKSAKIGVLPARAVVALTGRTPEWVRVDLGGRPGFLRTSDVEEGVQGPAKADFRPHLQVTPPILKLAVDKRSTTQDHLMLRGTATDDRRVADVFALVSNIDQKVIEKKVFYRSNRKASDPKKASFEARIPLWPGQNYVTVVARENDEVRSSERLILTREGVATTASATDRTATKPGSDRFR